MSITTTIFSGYVEAVDIQRVEKIKARGSFVFHVNTPRCV